MAELDDYLDRLDGERANRARELIAIKACFDASDRPFFGAIYSKATLVLCYGVWEGFYNLCVSEYFEFLKARGGRIGKRNWMLLLGVLNSNLESLKDRNHSDKARFDFVQDLKGRIDSKYGEIDDNPVKARSNLNYDRLLLNYNILNFDVSALQKHRIRLDRELVGWRNAVAHGEAPDLSNFDIVEHVNFTAELLVVLSDSFQQGMLKRM